MANQLEIPILNPLKWVPVYPDANTSYYTKWEEDHIFEDTLYDWQEKVHMYQPWMAGDVIVQQMTSNFNPLLIQIVDSLGNILISQNMTAVRANKYNPGFYLYECRLDSTTLAPGLYKGLLTPGGSLPDQLKTEWFYVCPSNYRTVLVTYYNIRYHGDVVFETGIQFNFRVPAFFDDKVPSSLDTLYTDQDLNTVQLSSKPSKQKTFYLGIGNGVPPWMVEKMNWALSCSNTVFDNKLFAKTDSAKWTDYPQEGTKLRGYSIDLQPGINRPSLIYNPTIDTTKKITLMYNIDQSIMGSMAPTGGTIVFPITSIE